MSPVAKILPFVSDIVKALEMRLKDGSNKEAARKSHDLMKEKVNRLTGKRKELLEGLNSHPSIIAFLDKCKETNAEAKGHISLNRGSFVKHNWSEDGKTIELVVSVLITSDGNYGWRDFVVPVDPGEEIRNKIKKKEAKIKKLESKMSISSDLSYRDWVKGDVLCTVAGELVVRKVQDYGVDKFIATVVEKIGSSEIVKPSRNRGHRHDVFFMNGGCCCGDFMEKKKTPLPEPLSKLVKSIVEKSTAEREEASAKSTAAQEKLKEVFSERSKFLSDWLTDKDHQELKVVRDITGEAKIVHTSINLNGKVGSESWINGKILSKGLPNGHDSFGFHANIEEIRKELTNFSIDLQTINNGQSEANQTFNRLGGQLEYINESVTEMFSNIALDMLDISSNDVLSEANKVEAK